MCSQARRKIFSELQYSTIYHFQFFILSYNFLVAKELMIFVK